MTHEGHVTGPADYMEERFPKYAATLRDSHVVKHGVLYHGLKWNEAVEIALQTDYAEWRAMRDFVLSLKGKA